MSEITTRSLAPRRGHSLLETVVAAGVFILVAIALSGVWVMYGSALAKSGDVLAANHVARSVSEGLVANGYDWIATQEGLSPLPEMNFPVKRRIRGRVSDVHYNVTYEVVLNTGVDPDTRTLSRFLPEDVAQLTVSVRWRSDTGGKDILSGTYNNEIVQVSYVYRGAMN